jgi:hypothetical protein
MSFLQIPLKEGLGGVKKGGPKIEMKIGLLYR